MAYHLSRGELAQARETIKHLREQSQELTLRIQSLLEMRDNAKDEHLMADFDKMVTELVSQRADIQQLCRENEAKISPMRNLPSELLSLVMEAHVHANHHSPWGLLAVCRQWRMICRSTPQIWSRLHVRFMDQSQRSIAMRSYSANFLHGVICNNLECLEIVITRSAAVPLAVTLELKSEPSDNLMLDLLCRQAGHRWRHAYLILSSVSPNFIDLWRGLGVRFPHLQSVEFDQHCHQNSMSLLLQTIQETSPNLNAIYAHSTTLFSSASDITSPFRSVRHLTLHIHDILFFGTAPKAMWNKLPKVESFALDDVYGHLSLDASQPLEFLRVLALKGKLPGSMPTLSNRLRLLTFVHLEAVPISGPEHEPYSIFLPSVTHFTLINAFYMPLQYFSLPALKFLELRGNTLGRTEANEEMDMIWNPETFGKAPSPTMTLHFEPRANDAYILAAFRLFDCLKNLHLYFDTSPLADSKVLASLAVAPKKKVLAGGQQAMSKWKSPMCPDLQLVTVTCKSSSEKDGALAEALDRIYLARLGTGSEMERPLMSIGKVIKSEENEAGRLM